MNFTAGTMLSRALVSSDVAALPPLTDAEALQQPVVDARKTRAS